MTNSFHLFLVAAATAAAATAQVQTVLFTGRFPFTSQSAAFERPNGAISRLEEFDFSYVLPQPGSPARTLLPATAMQCYLGDGNNDGNYLKFANWKTYFQQIGIGGIFVKASDRAAVSWDKVWFTVRRNAAATAGNSPGTLQFEVLTGNGTTPYTVVPGDWLRLLPNGNVEFFLTQAQMVTAVGAQSGSATIGAGALLQAANGDLYYSPVDGSHWVNGNQGGTSVAYDGAILKIDAANITYDGNGNVQALAPNSARILINEITTVPNVRGLVAASGAVDRFGAALVAPAYGYGKTVGLAFDPNGGTFTPALPDSTGAFPPEPNLLFAGDGGGYGGTIFSTANNGSIATINGVLCGSNTLGVAANGSWLGVNQDAANFQPTYMGFTLCDVVAEVPLVVDQNGFGSLPLASSQANWDIDVSTQPAVPVFLFLSLGPVGPGLAPAAVPTGFVPLPFTSDSWDDVFLTGGLASLGFTVTDSFGLGTVTVPNPNTGGFTGVTLTVQGIGLMPSGFQLSTPMLVQLQ
ncbi:MAG: hypothetical protein JNK15_25630 [Planctomycetes bacterium]|nr:hypothetical protein [Planctomycetota bacterium]